MDCAEKDYTVVIMRSRDRPKLLFDTVCMLTDMQYMVYHETIDSEREAYQDETISKIEERIVAWTFLPKENGENMQILHHQINGSHAPHYDNNHKESNLVNGGNRVATILMHLSTGTRAVVLQLCLFSQMGMAQLRQNYYASICPNVENIVRNVVANKFKQTFVTAPATLRLFFHDCMVQGCDASIIVASSGNNTAEKDHPDNLSLAGDGFDTVIKAKAAVDAVPQCKNKVSCADILALAARDVIVLAGGPNYAVELGRLDGLSSTAASVNGKLPHPDFNLNKLTPMFASHGLSQTDMIALSAAHTLGFSHCSRFSNRIYNFLPPRYTVDPTISKSYVSQLRGMCPKNVDPRVAINMDPITPNTFDNQYFKNLQRGMGVLTSDQVLYTDTRSRPTVNSMAQDSKAFEKAFVSAITKMGRIGVKMGSNGNIRHDCGAFN